MRKIRIFIGNIKNLSRWFKIIWKDRDWDFGFMLYLERKKLQNVLRWYEENNYGHHVFGWHDYCTMKWALECLNIILESDWWTIKSPNDTSSIDWYKLTPEERNACYVIKPYINVRNMKRFLPYYNNDEDYANPTPYMKIDLREEKAWRLYHKIREQYMRDWWD